MANRPCDDDSTVNIVTGITISSIITFCASQNVYWLCASVSVPLYQLYSRCSSISYTEENYLNHFHQSRCADDDSATYADFLQPRYFIVQ